LIDIVKRSRMRNWEEVFQNWIKPASDTEDQKIQNAIDAVKKALAKDAILNRFTKIYIHGSYRNNVNVRLNSDIDIGILYTGDTFGFQLPSGKTKHDYGLGNPNISYDDFRQNVSSVLYSHFGYASVTEGNKAFKLSSTTYRVDADIIPVLVHRSYNPDGSYICGVEFDNLNGTRIINWPERLMDNEHWINQHYENGVSKNTRTSRRYKSVVRILKRIMYEMADAGSTAAKDVSGFTIECLVWNVPDSLFDAPTWSGMIQKIIAHLWNNTRTLESCNEWAEVSDLKYLFGSFGDSDRAIAHRFINEAWDYIGVSK